MRPTLHVLGLFHTVTDRSYSHCAFTGKVLRFARMMQAEGWRVTEYGNGETESGCHDYVQLMSAGELAELTGERDRRSFHGDLGTIGTPWHRRFEELLVPAIMERAKPRDVICHPFGAAHRRLLSDLPHCVHVESGIGYPHVMHGTFKVFESQAWRHWHLGRADCNAPTNYEWVIPNYYDLEDWEVRTEPGRYVGFLGRLTGAKGLETVREVARRVNLPVVACGQGDPGPWQGDNLRFMDPLVGKERSEFLGNAACVLMPTSYVEPFGGSGVEAMLCGTPVLSVNWGAFTETVVNGVTGFRCQTIREWVEGVRKCADLDRSAVAAHARGLYGTGIVGPQYTRAFEMLDGLWEDGWWSGCR